jgi:N-acetylglucosamine kinase-like BadF-type ATPase
MSHYFLGVDIGSTKSHTLIADNNGQILGYGRAGAGNYQVVGYEGMAAVLQAATAQALTRASLTAEQIAFAGLGISGYDWPSQRTRMIETIRAAGIGAPLEIVNDALLGLLAGAPEMWGVALVAGSGSNCRGRDRNGREGRVSGEGVRFGEYGGASELVFLAFQAVARAWSRRGPATSLSDAFVRASGARDLDDLIEGVALDRYQLVAGTAPLVFQAAGAGDLVARELLAQCGQGLADLALGVIRQLELEREIFDVVLLGSLYHGGALLTEPLDATIRAVAPGARLKRLTAPPVVGAVLLAMQQAGIVRPELRDVLEAGAVKRLSSSVIV